MKYKNYKLVLINSLVFVLIFLSLFTLFKLDLNIFYIGFGFVSIYVLFVVVYLYVFDRKENKSLKKIEDENKELKTLLENENKKKQDLEEYFLLWVHQIKAPITAMYLLLNESDNQKCEELRNQILRIENYTSMAINYIKITNPDRDMDFSYINIDDIISQLIQKYSMQFISKKNKLHYIKSNSKIFTDGKLISIVIEQLLNNALKYTENGEIWIKYDAKNNTFLIKDTGIGILAENINKIFDKGYSGFNGRLNEKSSGIGLYLAKVILTRLNHKISVKSEINKGSEFIIEF